MKKRYLLSLLAAAGGGIYALSKVIKKEKNEDEQIRKSMVEQYEKEGYKVHAYNNHTDFMFFNYEKNEKRHVFYSNGLETYETFHAKLHAYYFHFTQEFYFICKNSAGLEETKNFYLKWCASLDEKTIETYGKPIAYFKTVQELIQ